VAAARYALRNRSYLRPHGICAAACGARRLAQLRLAVMRNLAFLPDSVQNSAILVTSGREVIWPFDGAKVAIEAPT